MNDAGRRFQPARTRARIMVVAALCIAPSGVFAQITSSSPGGFISEHIMAIAAPRSRVYQALTAEVGRWWNPIHSYSGKATNFSIDPRAGGCFCEQLEDGAVAHMTVVYVARNAMLRMVGGLGPLQSMVVSGSMTFTLTDTDAGTRLQYTYAVGGYAPDGLESLAGPVDQVQLDQLQRLKRYIETGRPDTAASQVH